MPQHTTDRTADFTVWLGSMHSEAGARRLMNEILTAYPGPLGDLAREIRAVDLAEKGRWYRVIFGRGLDRNEAEAVCRDVQRLYPEQFCRPVTVQRLKYLKAAAD